LRSGKRRLSEGLVGSITGPGTAAIGASWSLPRVSAKVASPSDLPTFVIVQTDR
jgi:hypothetical protein